MNGNNDQCLANLSTVFYRVTFGARPPAGLKRADHTVPASDSATLHKTIQLAGR